MQSITTDQISSVLALVAMAVFVATVMGIMRSWKRQSEPPEGSRE
jgi:hypothetical protein